MLHFSGKSAALRAIPPSLRHRDHPLARVSCDFHSNPRFSRDLQPIARFSRNFSCYPPIGLEAEQDGSGTRTCSHHPIRARTQGQTYLMECRLCGRGADHRSNTVQQIRQGPVGNPFEDVGGQERESSPSMSAPTPPPPPLDVTRDAVGDGLSAMLTQMTFPPGMPAAARSGDETDEDEWADEDDEG